MVSQVKISVQTENIFPIIKKWLYSEKIFSSELVSNATDAISKLKKIALTEELEGGTDYKIAITFDKEARTLSIEDNGLGMSGEEIKSISTKSHLVVVKNCQKYESAWITKLNHRAFWIRFYSSFMVSTKS